MKRSKEQKLKNLDKDEQAELREIFADPKISSYLRSAEICLFLEDLELDVVAEALTEKIKANLRKQSKIISKSLYKNLREILLQMITLLSSQREEIMNYFLFSSLRERQKEIKLWHNPLKILQAWIRPAFIHSLKVLGLDRGLSHLGKTERIEQYVNTLFEQLTKDCRSDALRRFKKYLLLLLAAVIMGIAIKPDYEVTIIVTIAWILLYISFCYSDLSQGPTSMLIKNLNSQKMPYYAWETVKIVDFKDENKSCFSYLRVLESCDIDQEQYKETGHPESGLKVNQELTHQAASDHKVISVKRQKSQDHSKSLRRVFCLKPAFQPTWHSEKVLFGKKNCIIPAEEIYEVSAPFFSKQIRYFAFFNAKAIEEQGVKKDSPEWRSYNARIKKGTIVAPHGQTGIKQLKPQILTDLRFFSGGKFREKLFSWSVKTLGQPYRLLGTICDMQLSAEGIRYKLIDFCWHRPDGPGH